MTSLAHAALDQLSALLGKRCLTDPDSAQRYGVDWTKVWAPAPSAVVLPLSSSRSKNGIGERPQRAPRLPPLRPPRL